VPVEGAAGWGRCATHGLCKHARQELLFRVLQGSEACNFSQPDPTRRWDPPQLETELCTGAKHRQTRPSELLQQHHLCRRRAPTAVATRFQGRRLALLQHRCCNTCSRHNLLLSRCAACDWGNRGRHPEAHQQASTRGNQKQRRCENTAAEGP
jgi:hypothetical protein